MSATLQFDEDASRRVEKIYTTPDVIEQRQTILRALALQPGERAIDIGSGPGLLACEMAEAVGRSGRVCGVDVSENMLALARARRPPTGSGPIEYQEAGAHTLPYAEESFDVAVCTLEYPKRERTGDLPGVSRAGDVRAVREAARRAWICAAGSGAPQARAPGSSTCQSPEAIRQSWGTPLTWILASHRSSTCNAR